VNQAITLQGVSKMYRAPSHERGIWSVATGLVRKGGRRGEHSSVNPPRWALRDVSFSVEPGEIVGLIGQNGAGKTTILKLVAGVTEPTHGHVHVRGRLGSLLELGAGFHSELSGRENVFLNGQIMGMTRREIRDCYDAIVDFAELSEFMDMPVKRYSSGMTARLGFAVAIHMEPDVLLVDEVLAVGDENFSRKSLERMLAFVKNGKSVVFVSHNAVIVEHLCDKVLWLEQGQIREYGKSRDIVAAYLEEQDAEYVKEARLVEDVLGRGIVIEDVSLRDASGQVGREFPMGADLEVVVQYRVINELAGGRFVIGVMGRNGPLFSANMLIDGESIAGCEGRGTVSCVFRNVPLMPGAYQIYGEVWGQGFDPVFRWSEWARFRITQANGDLLSLGDKYSVCHLRTEMPIAVKYDWNLGQAGKLFQVTPDCGP
jgi:lipopolysaccharide transport system ATP-binding protein